MSDSDPHQVSRRDFIKGTAAVIGGLIGVLIGIPSLAYLLSPAVKSQGESDAVIALGPLANYPIGIPTRFDFTQTKVNGWERTDQWLSWDFRTITPGKYTLQIKYLAPSGNQTAGTAGGPGSSRAYRVTLNAQSVERTVRTDSRNFITEELFTIDLPKGTHHLKVQPVAINNDLMRLLECQLIQKP